MTEPFQETTLFNTLKALLHGLPSPEPTYCLHKHEILSRRRLIEAENLLKLKAGPDQDFLDTVNIIARQGEALQLDYLWNWADRLGLQGEVAYVLKTSAFSI